MNIRTKVGAFSIIVPLVVISTGICFLSVQRYRNSQVLASSGKVFSNYPQLVPGMSELQVESLLGVPSRKSINPHFEHKSWVDWLKIQQDVNSAIVANASATSNPKLLREQRELTRQYLTIWLYNVSSDESLTLYFGEDETLLYFRWRLAHKLYGPRPEAASGIDGL